MVKQVCKFSNMYFASHLYNLSFLLVALILVPFGVETANFTKNPSNINVTVPDEGHNVSIVWDYSVGDRNTKFSSNSPVWSYYDQSGTKYVIAYEDKFDSWKWKISPTCPARLKHRLSKADTATLVITNVSLADSGKYECELKLISGSVPPSTMQLTVRILIPTTAPSSPIITTPKIPTTTPTPKPTPTPTPPTPTPTPPFPWYWILIAILVFAVLVIIGVVIYKKSCCGYPCCPCCDVICCCIKKKKKEENQSDKDKEMSNKVGDEEGSPTPKAV